MKKPILFVRFRAKGCISREYCSHVPPFNHHNILATKPILSRPIFWPKIFISSIDRFYLVLSFVIMYGSYSTYESRIVVLNLPSSASRYKMGIKHGAPLTMRRYKEDVSQRDVM